jgi:FkbM family methyltransferase
MDDVRIVQLEPAGTGPRLGVQCSFALSGRPFEAVQFLLEHERIRYPAPLPVEPDGSVRVFPEAPGRWSLIALWRAPRESGEARFEFEIDGPRGVQPRPAWLHRRPMWVPTAWDGALLRQDEQAVMRYIAGVLRPGATAYDLGANVGAYSLLLARTVGDAGTLYSVEPNPLCVYFLRANLRRARARVTILPVAVADRAGQATFRINYGSSLLGLVGGTSAATKPGHEILVEQDSLDNLIARLGLRAPDFIKIDVEGAEALAVAGMMDTLKRHRPVLLCELHGVEPGRATLNLLEPLHYRYFSPAADRHYPDAASAAAGLKDERIQLFGLP